jgi:ubiquinone/menaquinone biosynthesis C-methylase UbiE
VNTVIESYSRLASQYEDPENLNSCWGAVTRYSLDHLVMLHEKHKIVVDVGCGVGRELAHLALSRSPEAMFIGIEPAAKMRERALARTAPLANVQILDGSFENLPLENSSVDYLYSILGFHWTTDLEKSVAELARVLKSTGEMDLTFIGRHNGREFIQQTTPVFMKYMTPAMLVRAALLRKQLTVEAALALFANVFGPRRLSVTETYHTYYDTLDGHWSWWLRIEGQLVNIPESVRADCDQEVRAAIGKLATDKGIPYTVHLLHARLRDS